MAPTVRYSIRTLALVLIPLAVGFGAGVLMPADAGNGLQPVATRDNPPLPTREARRATLYFERENGSWTANSITFDPYPAGECESEIKNAGDLEGNAPKILVEVCMPVGETREIVAPPVALYTLNLSVD